METELILHGAEGGNLDQLKNLFKDKSDQEIKTLSCRVVYVLNIETCVFEAAEAGMLDQLKSLLKDKSEQEIEALSPCVTYGATPLIAACICGRADVAAYLIEECHVDINQSVSSKADEFTLFLADSDTPIATITVEVFDLLNTYININTLINKYVSGHASTALSCACYQRNFDLFAYLVEQGADIEKVNECSGFTILMQACICEQIPIVQLLLNKKIDVNRQDFKGRTALHYCASTVSPTTVDIAQMLIKNGAELTPDYSGHTALLVAAKSCNEILVNLFMQHFKIDKVQKIEAFEVLGAAYLLIKNNTAVAFSNFQHAMDLHYEYREFPIKPCLSSALLSSIDIIDVLSFEELNDHHRIRLAALLIMQRVNYPFNPDCFQIAVKYIGKKINEGNFNMFFHLGIYTIENILIHTKPRKGFVPIRDLLKFFIEKFVDILAYIEILPVSFKSMFLFLRKIVKVIKTFMQANKWFESFDIIMYKTVEFLGLLCTVLKYPFAENEVITFKKIVYELVSLNARTVEGFSVLHIACSVTDRILGTSGLNSRLEFPKSSVVDLLLTVNADCSVIDRYGNTPLHMIAKYSPYDHGLFMSVLKHGGHLDTCNYKRETPLQLIRENGFVFNPISHISLQCLSAKVIRTYNITYRGCVSKNLEEFLDIH